MTAVIAAAAVRVHVPLRRPLVTARGSWRVADSWLLQLRDADGRCGLGEATLGPGADPRDQAALDALIREVVAEPGHAAAAVARGAAALDDPAAPEQGPAGASLQAALATAALDLGREPVGRSRATVVPVNAMIGAESLHAAVASARSATDDGFTTLKLKGGGEATSADLVARLRAVRDAVGPDIGLRLDVNGAWDAPIAARRLAAIEAVEAIGLELVEQPVAPGPDAAILLAGLRARTAIPIAADESVSSTRAAAGLIAAGAVAVLVVKPARVGGPAAALAIADLAAASGVGVIISTLLETGVGLRAALVTAALLPSGLPTLAHGLGTGPLLASDLVRGRGVAVSAGAAACSAGPGLELVLDHRAVARYAIERVGPWA